MNDDCPICKTPMVFAFEAQVLQKYNARYERCGECGFLRIRDPYWLDEAYSNAISAIDTGLMVRNLALVGRIGALCLILDHGKGPYLDVAGGYGVLVRLMRDRGLEFRWSDKYATNIMARGFEHDAGDGPYAAVTAIEVLEHVQDPVAFVRDALATGGTDTLIFSTELFSGTLPPKGWSYYAREGGQHISFYRADTLTRLGKTLGMAFHSYGGVHIFTRRELSERRLHWALSRSGQIVTRLQLRQRPPLTMTDSIIMRDRLTASD